MENIKIKITDNNTDKINAVIATAEKGCRQRKITYTDIVNIINDYAETVQLSKTRLKGTEITVDVNAQTFPHSYKGIAESTHFRAVFTGSHWYLTDVFRWKVNSPDKTITAKYTAETIEYIKSRAVIDYTYISK